VPAAFSAFGVEVLPLINILPVSRRFESALIECFIANFSRLAQVNEFSRRMLQLLDH